MPDTMQPPTQTSATKQEVFKANMIEQSLGFFVGANFSDHYTHQDARDITMYAPLTWTSAGMAATGIAFALETYMGVPFVASFFPAAAAYTCLDRAFVRAEALSKADRMYASLLDPYVERNEQGKIIKNTYADSQKRSRWLLPLFIRLGMAGVTSTISGGVLIEKIAHREIALEAQQSYNRDNKPLFDRIANEKLAYDRSIADAAQRITTLTNDLNQPPLVATVPMSAEDRAALASSSKILEDLQRQIAQLQQKLAKDKADMLAEESGVPRPGTSGIAGKRGRYTAARLATDEDEQNIQNLTAQAAARQRKITAIETPYQKMVAANQAVVDAKNREVTLARQAAVTDAQHQLADLKNNRSKIFDELDVQKARQTISLESETGIFADMVHLTNFLNNPKTGAVATSFTYLVEAFIFLAEMSAVLGAAFIKSPTSSEKIDARLRAEVTGRVERRVMTELNEVVPMRKRLRAMAQSPWEKMQGFFRPEPPAQNGPRQEGPRP